MKDIIVSVGISQFCYQIFENFAKFKFPHPVAKVVYELFQNNKNGDFIQFRGGHFIKLPLKFLFPSLRDIFFGMRILLLFSET